MAAVLRRRRSISRTFWTGLGFPKRIAETRRNPSLWRGYFRQGFGAEVELSWFRRRNQVMITTVGVMGVPMRAILSVMALLGMVHAPQERQINLDS